MIITVILTILLCGGQCLAWDDQLDAEDMELLVQSRVKRSVLIFPNTLWCGKGHRAKHYNDLGKYRKADMCCREHDHCPPTLKIPAWKRKYHYFNLRIYPISHSSCDNKFYTCLKAARTFGSRAVGHTFFNVLKVPYFVFKTKKICAKRRFFFCVRYRHEKAASVRSARRF